MLVVLYLYFSELWNVDFSCMVLEDVEVVPLLFIAEEILYVLVVDFKVAEVEFIAAFEERLEKVFIG